LAGAARTLFSAAHEVKVAVDDITFAVPEGQIVGYLGPNGAGKSTTIKMLTGILAPSAGSARILGLDPLRQRHRCCQSIGVLFGQRSQLWWDIPLVESLLALRRIYGLSGADYAGQLAALSDLLDLGPLLHVPVRQLSLGQRMRGELAATVLHRPRLLFLDEPTIGVDAVGKTRFRDFIREINRRDGATVMLTSHDLADVEDACQRVLLLDEGRLVFDGSPEEMTSRFAVRSRLTLTLGGVVSADRLAGALAGLPAGAEGKVSGEGRVEVAFDRTRTGPAQILGSLAGLPIADMRLAEASLTGAFMKLYAQRGEEGGAG
jgi:ABC-2 type transport system ATP-binding protein